MLWISVSASVEMCVACVKAKRLARRPLPTKPASIERMSATSSAVRVTLQSQLSNDWRSRSVSMPANCLGDLVDRRSLIALIAAREQTANDPASRHPRWTRPPASVTGTARPLHTYCHIRPTASCHKGRVTLTFRPFGAAERFPETGQSFIAVGDADGIRSIARGGVHRLG